MHSFRSFVAGISGLLRVAHLLQVVDFRPLPITTMARPVHGVLQGSFSMTVGSNYLREEYWFRTFRVVTEYATTIALGVLTSYLILGRRW
jgi:hypothetical protein